MQSRRLQIQFAQQIFDAEAMVGGHVFEDSVKCADFDRIVVWDSEVVLTACWVTRRMWEPD